MFTGIVETTGKVVDIEKDRGNIHVTIKTPIAKELKVDQSMAHDGICLTVVKVIPEKDQYVITAVKESCIAFSTLMSANAILQIKDKGTTTLP